MKALYLDGNAGLDVSLDGASLRVRRSGRADGHYPLPRILRVIALGEVRWQPEALSACLNASKPVVVLDRKGRFVRVLYYGSKTPFGMSRRMGALLAIQKFRARYLPWCRQAERKEMLTALPHLKIEFPNQPSQKIWQKICRDQFRHTKIRPGGCYRFLLGLASAQIVSAFTEIGMPEDPLNWGRQEYRLFCDWLRMERWQIAILLGNLLENLGRKPERFELTEAFEKTSPEREHRILCWREGALLAMMGLHNREIKNRLSLPPTMKNTAAKKAAHIQRLCHEAISTTSNSGYIPFGSRGSLRTSARIVRHYLEYDRRVYESFQAS